MTSLPIFVIGSGYSEMTWLGRAVIQVVVILRQQIYVVKDVTVPGTLLVGFQETDVQQSSTIE